MGHLSQPLLAVGDLGSHIDDRHHHFMQAWRRSLFAVRTLPLKKIEWIGRERILHGTYSRLEGSILRSRNFSIFSRQQRSYATRRRTDSASQHHDLTSFLEYARRTQLNPASTVFTGTGYEYTVQETLKGYGFDLTRTGGRSDYGIDLLGSWNLPQHILSFPIKCLVQCKKLKAKLGPNLIRELEGAFLGAPQWLAPRDEAEAEHYNEKKILGIIVTPNAATKGVRDAIARSSWPMMWMLVDSQEIEIPLKKGQASDTTASLRDEDKKDTPEKAETPSKAVVRQILWNKAATELALTGIDVTLRYTANASGTPDDEPAKESILLWQGKPIFDTTVNDVT